LTIPSVAAISDFCLAALLRCHKSAHGAGWASADPRARIEEREELLLRWALSNDLRDLAARVASHPRDIRSAIAFETETYAGQIPGAVDARATLFEQERTGDPTLFVVSEPSLSPLTRRNHVLAWVLREAQSMTLAAIRRHVLGPKQEWIHERARQLDHATRSKLLREVMLSPSGRRRPSSADIRDASKSMSLIYRLAAKAMLAFESIEAMDPEAIRQVLSVTLVAQLEEWQKLELATALAAAEALATATGERPRWKGSIAGGSEIVAIGRYSIRWQNALPKRSDAQLDPSELLARHAAQALDAILGMARTDLTVRDTATGNDVSHLECKWFGSPSSATSAITDAVSQLVRYCRDSRPTNIAEAAEMLVDCMVVCSDLAGFAPSVDGATPIGLTDFDGLANNNLIGWAHRLHAKIGGAGLA
jgi:hypothetical protein